MVNFRRGTLALVSALALIAASDVVSPEEIYGTLFRQVQLDHVFDDGKTFADAAPKRDPQAILADYRASPPMDKTALKDFVLANFIVPGINDTGTVPMRRHIQMLWPQLVRLPEPTTPGGSKIALPEPYVVPGGRFREIYYWDSYFTMLGLAADGRHDLVDSMLDDFTDLIDRFGHIPNGTRTYYLSRSQPPFFALMLDISQSKDAAVQARRLAALRKEYAFWMQGKDCLSLRVLACENVVRMPDGSLLNRYWDAKDTPRDESYAEDVATAKAAAPRPEAQTYRDLRAAAESGWDFSSRWLANPQSLETIRTVDIVPVDLNALMWAMERRIAAGCRAARDAVCASRFNRLADTRSKAVDKYLWDQAEARYADWNIATSKPTQVLSAATLYPLYVGMASPAQGKAVANTTRKYLLAQGGLRTTLVQTGQQWDAPNGWAPLQWIAIAGLDRYGAPDLARDVAHRWITTVARTYGSTGKMLEKYDIENRKPGGGGEYPLQDGFGWTNGVASALLAKYGDFNKVAESAQKEANQ
ncbi:MAG: alpha,alpha-trehalase TreF [Sphingomonadaceae bacterium]